MGRFAKEPEGKGGGDFAEIEPGNYAGRCWRLIELGTRFNEMAQKSRNELMISFELPDELMSTGLPYSVTWWVTNSLHEKANLRIGLQTWRKKPFTDDELKGFDLATIVGVPGLVTVDHKKNGKAYAAGVGPLPKGMTCGPAVNAPQVFFWDEFDQKVWDELPDGIKRMMKESEEYRAMFLAAEPRRTEDHDDEIPF